MLNTKYKDSLEQSFCRQRTEEEQRAIVDRHLQHVREQIEELLNRPGMVYTVDLD